ncbi:uncharacterized protein LOC126839909 isoform X2 [Adelges cooleyi]|uniref:uncharacterized protein LOC126839909 isoform X2 n=1 Tax=Adelges cooleyi TaxID=133065 RepID=UPI00217FF912|nr:uncharacterized protein LOC126839909 isoform X2 [Adelges cooleyi]
MKLLFVLLSFVFAIVLAELTDTDYKKQVYISNSFLRAIEPIHSTLDKSVKSLILSAKSITTLNLQLVAPEIADIYEPELLEQYIKNEKQIQNTIRMDHGKNRHCINYKTTLRLIGLQDPIPSNINFKALDLSALGATRRSITGQSLKRLISNLEEGDVSMQLFRPLQACYLITLNLTLPDPRYRIKDAGIDKQGVCKITEHFGRPLTFMKFVDGFWRVDQSTGKKILKLI